MSGETADLDRLLCGDKAAWDRFVGRFAPVIFAAVHRRLGPAGRGGDAEDVAQDVFVRLCARDFRLLRSYDAAKARITTWLTVIASSAAIDHLRRQRGFTQSIDDVPEASLAVDPVEPARLKIPDGLLSPRQTLVLEMLYMRELDVTDVAAALAIDPQTVRSTHHKALTKLRAHFRDPGG
jgi:RNA polymerase sigma-70 factor (ECF subfamily)